MNMVKIAVLALGVISGGPLAHSAETSSYKIVGAGYLEDRSFVAVIQNEDNSLRSAGVICGAGSYYPFTGKERIYIASRDSKGLSRSADMTQTDCEKKLQSMREATLQNPVIINLETKND